MYLNGISRCVGCGAAMSLTSALTGVDRDMQNAMSTAPPANETDEKPKTEVSLLFCTFSSISQLLLGGRDTREDLFEHGGVPYQERELEASSRNSRPGTYRLCPKT